MRCSRNPQFCGDKVATRSRDGGYLPAITVSTIGYCLGNAYRAPQPAYKPQQFLPLPLYDAVR